MNTDCRGKTQFADHPNMVELGPCSHRVTGSIHGYTVHYCPDCDVVAHRGPISFACGRGIKAVKPTAENCLGLQKKAELDAQKYGPNP